MDNSLFNRTELLLGREAMERIRSKRVIIFGVGGVGSWCAECLVREGIEHLTLVDSDVVCVTNCNRQLMATTKTIGEPKVEALKKRLLEINPEAKIVALQKVCAQLGISPDEPIVIENMAGQEVDCQKTFDGKLLLFVSVHPHGKASFTVSKGKPSAPKAYARGKVYPIRKDDLAWENDRSAYRLYGPALQKTGERSFGIDVWVKNTPELVVEERYTKDREGNMMEDSLRKAGQKVALAEIDRNTSFHLNHGNGMDAYGVDPSLGCGAPALMNDGKLVFPYCYKTCRIHDNGPLRFTAELTYGTTADGITEHRLISLDKGSHFNRMTVWYDGLEQPTALAAGVVLHGDEGIALGKNYVRYADPTDRPDLHQSQVYVATLFPNGVNKTKVLKGELNHAIGIVNHYQGTYTYYFGSAWSLYDVCSEAQWQTVIDEFMNNLRRPLTYNITK